MKFEFITQLLLTSCNSNFISKLITKIFNFKNQPTIGLSGQSSPSNLSSNSSQEASMQAPGLETGKHNWFDPPWFTVCKQSSYPGIDKYAGGSPPTNFTNFTN